MRRRIDTSLARSHLGVREPKSHHQAMAIVPSKLRSHMPTSSSGCCGLQRLRKPSGSGKNAADPHQRPSCSQLSNLAPEAGASFSEESLHRGSKIDPGRIYADGARPPSTQDPLNVVEHRTFRALIETAVTRPIVATDVMTPASFSAWPRPCLGRHRYRVSPHAQAGTGARSLREGSRSQSR